MTDNSISSNHTSSDLEFMQREDTDRCMRYVGKDVFAGLNEAMIGLSKAPKESTTQQGSIEAATVEHNVADELKTFEKECKQISANHTCTVLTLN